MLRNLLVRGGGIQVNDCLKRWGWTGRDPAITTVFTLEANSGSILGLRYESRGPGPEITFKASELWQDADKEVSMTIKVTDLAKLRWVSVGSSRNQTEFMDSTDFQVEATHSSRGSLSQEEMAECRIGGFCMRFSVMPVQVGKAALYGGIIPLSREELQGKVGEWEVDLASPLIPTVALKLFRMGGRWQNALPMDLLPKEEEGDNVGIGHFPLLESVGAEEPFFPTNEALVTQLSAFLRSNNCTNNVNPGRLSGILSGDNTLPTSTTGVISYEWPDLTEGLQQPGGSGSAGVCLYSPQGRLCKACAE